MAVDWQGPFIKARFALCKGPDEPYDGLAKWLWRETTCKLCLKKRKP